MPQIFSQTFKVSEEFHKKSVKGRRENFSSSVALTSEGKSLETLGGLKNSSIENNNFQGSWLHKFDSNYTQRGLFHLNKMETVAVDYMKKKFLSVQHGTFSDLEASAIVLPFKDSDATLMIILPDSTTGLPDLESKLNQINLSLLSERMRQKVVNMMVPKFSKIVHKTVMEVNEEGIEADPVPRLPLCKPLTLCSHRTSSQEICFYADRPFVFALMQDSEVLFLGQKLE